MIQNFNDKLLLNLKILSKIQKNGRICRSYDGIISLEHSTFYQSLKRFVNQDSRKQSISEINSIINECIECLHNIFNSKFMTHTNTPECVKGCDSIRLILEELDGAKNGIENLKFTYKIDANIESQLDIILVKIQSVLKDCFSKLDDFNVSE